MATPTMNSAGRPHSIDLSLELEHQLALEEGDTGTPDSHTPAQPQGLGITMPSEQQAQSLDPHVLASIISQLRDQLTRLATERDDLLSHMATYVSREADLKDALQDMTDKFTAAREEVAASREQHADDQENISMLRAKVEESRRGLMKLQTESRRSSVMSTMTLDLGRAGGAGPLGPPTGRNSAFTPLTGTGITRQASSGHRRGASIASPGMPGIPTPNPDVADQQDASRRSHSRSPPKPNRRMSGLFLRSPSPAESAAALGPGLDGLEAQRIRKELQVMRDQLEETRHELTEANEARDASETCVKALRDFITENGIGAGEAPAIPAAIATPKAQHQAKKPSVGGWGSFKLWQTSGAVSAVPITSPPLASIPHSPDITTNSQGQAQAGPSSQPPPQPLTRKLTGFFGARSSDYAASIASTNTNAAAPEVDGTSESSVEEAEPISPVLGPQLSTRLVRTDSLPDNRITATEPKNQSDETLVHPPTVDIAVPS